MGSTLQFVAATPNYEDYEILLKNFIRNNKKSKINLALQNRINELTNQINPSFGTNAFLNDNKSIFFEYLGNLIINYLNQNNLKNKLIINYLNYSSLPVVLGKNNLIY